MNSDDIKADVFKDEVLESKDTLEDEKLEALFASFKTVSASSDLIAKTLASIEAARAEEETIVSLEDAREKQSKIKRASKRTIRTTRTRVLRAVLVAATVAALSFGGVAYATPTAYVEVVVDETSIELGVNRFGYTVSAEATDEAGQEFLRENNVRNMSYEKSLEHIFDGHGEGQGEDISYSIDGGDERIQNDLKGKTEKVAQEKNRVPREKNPDTSTIPSDAPTPDKAQATQGDPNANDPVPREEDVTFDFDGAERLQEGQASALQGDAGQSNQQNQNQQPSGQSQNSNPPTASQNDGNHR